MARRGWGEGSICRRVVRRGDTEYLYWRAILPGAGNGPRKEHQERSQAAARAWLRRELDRRDRGLPREDGLTVGAYALDWLKDTALHVRPSTLAFYGASIKHFDSIADVPLARLNPQMVRDLIAEKSEGLSTRTVRGVVQTLSLVLKRAEEDGHVTRNVAALVRLPKLETKPARHFTAAQAKRFLEVAKDDELGSLFAVSLGTGLRRGELLDLTWRDVDLDRATVAVHRSKTAAGLRSVPLPRFAVEALTLREKRPGNIWPVDPTYVSKHFAALCRRAGVPVINLHGLRHTASTLMAEAGVPEETRRWILGHSKVEMTRKYSHESEALMRDAVERLGRVVA